MARKKLTAEQVEAKFWSKLESHNHSGCWNWTGLTDDKGYGRIHISGGKLVYTHRYAYELLVGPIPKGLVSDHLCRNHACANPAHIELVTVSENVLRGVGRSATNARKTHCKQGHELTGDNLILVGRKDYPDRKFRRCRECYNQYARDYRAGKRRPHGSGNHHTGTLILVAQTKLAVSA